MKKLANAAWLLLLAACATKDPVAPVIPTDPVKYDTAKIEISVYDATQWATDKPYGVLRTGVTVNLYKSQADFNAKTVAFSTTTDANGKALFKGLPAAAYYIEAKLDDLTNMPVRNESNKGYRYDSIYQVYTIPARVNELFPYPGNFIYKDVNGDNKLDNNDYVTLPADLVRSDSGKTNTIRILIGRDDNVNNKPFATSQAAKDALNNLYDEVHTWHQLVAVIDAVYTDDANCSSLPGYCELDQYRAGSGNAQIQTMWNNAISIFNKANRIAAFSFKATNDSSLVGEANGIHAYMRMKLTDLFGGAPNYTSLVPPANLQLANTDEARYTADIDMFSAMHLLPYLSRSNTNRSHLSKEAAYTLIVQNSNHYSNAMLTESWPQYYRLPIFDNDSAVVLETNKMNSYTSNNSREIIWGDTRPISNPDLKAIFKKGNYLPIINLNQLITIRAEQMANRFSPDIAVNMINLLAYRIGIPTNSSAQPTKQEAMNFIQQATRPEQAMEGNTLNNLVRWGIHMNVLGPLGFKFNNDKLPIPLSFLNNYPGVNQNAGY
ncbi:hypothetical protein CLV59_103329 [Chitinophaga dinghuensis]|uniref:SusD-like starch-binding protein associating with outer membrane n=1 Tax=Chitinophaga dinghuensis TaxID=1539050 RepID=A0A327W3J6_9BACT|nr:hypothetical protein [Chitinophaga dinghuensis]RAJ83362.1 hypothetical protein CLV59_103329 [Chitinophaga dinghuensis]